MAGDKSVFVFENSKELIAKIAEDVLNLAVRAVADHGSFSMALSGGGTPRPLYEAFASAPLKYEMPWKKTFFFFGDERCVPHTSDESNYKMVRQAMFKPDLVRDENVFATEMQDSDPHESALLYEEEIQSFFNLQEGEMPRFDLILLGMGDDGHTASLFPGTEALKETKRICVANFVEKFNAHRITLTLPAINNARQVYFLVSGKGKADVLWRILCEKEKNSYPAQLVKSPKWYLDREAASKLDQAACKK